MSWNVRSRKIGHILGLGDLSPNPKLLSSQILTAHHLLSLNSEGSSLIGVWLNLNRLVWSIEQLKLLDEVTQLGIGAKEMTSVQVLLSLIHKNCARVRLLIEQMHAICT